jgi:hypothetical protein
MVAVHSYFPYTVAIPDPKNFLKHYELNEWCVNKFGPQYNSNSNTNGIWCSFYIGIGSPGYYRYYFLYEKDAILFGLIWP